MFFLIIFLKFGYPLTRYYYRFPLTKIVYSNQVGSRYLDHLIVERKYGEAASLCPKLLRGSPSAWERYKYLKTMKYVGNLLVIEVQLVIFSRWVFHFAHLRQLPVLVPYIPTENPILRDTAYEVCTLLLCPLVS